MAERLGHTAREFLDSSRAGGLVLTGGDTALSVCLALGSTALHLCGEVEPGLPWGVLADGPWAGLRVATKAGGFGGAESLLRAVDRMRAAP